MIKYLVPLMSALCLSACSTPDNKAYYRTNPRALERVIVQCPQQHPPQISCDELGQIAMELNRLVNEWKNSPQGFGSRIIALQNRLADSRETDVAAIKQDLHERLAIVAWLQSPTR